ncbi:MAG TPA: hypothetical protein VIO58_05460 [Candidatus Methanoperedens sp.]
MKYWKRYVAAAVAVGTVIAAVRFLPSETFITFVMAWLLLIPAAFAMYLAYGLREYMRDRKNRILVSVKPSEAMKALARRETELAREKELLYEDLRKGIKR